MVWWNIKNGYILLIVLILAHISLVKGALNETCIETCFNTTNGTTHGSHGTPPNLLYCADLSVLPAFTTTTFCDHGVCELLQSIPPGPFFGASLTHPLCVSTITLLGPGVLCSMTGSGRHGAFGYIQGLSPISRITGYFPTVAEIFTLIYHCCQPLCVCDPGWTNTPSFFTPSGSCSNPVCSGVAATSASVCSGHGTCTSPNVCSCTPSFTGDNCDSCISGFTGASCTTPLCCGVSATSPSVCSSHGICNSPNNCNCTIGFIGDNCDVDDPTTIECFGHIISDLDVCSGHGFCIAEDTCACRDGYSGFNCSIPRPTCDLPPKILFNLRGTTLLSALEDDAPLPPNNENDLTEEGSPTVVFSLNGIGGSTQSAPVFLVQNSTEIRTKITSCPVGYTLSFWARTPSIPISGNTVQAKIQFGGFSTFLLYCDPTSPFPAESFSVSKENCPGSALSTTIFFNPSTHVNLLPGILHFYTLVNFASGMKFYRDSVELIPVTPTFSFHPLNLTCPGATKAVHITLENFNFPLPPSSPDNFEISNIALTSRSLTPDEISDLFIRGSKFDIDRDFYTFECNGHSCLDPLVCGGPSQGICESLDNCTCNPLFTGIDCCNPDLTLKCFDIPFTEPLVCSNHGDCINTDTCVCETGFSGDNCSTVLCGEPVCNGHGTCLELNNCTCDVGYDEGTNSLCEPVCFGFVESALGVCNGHGTCVSPNICECDNGFFESSCQTLVVCDTTQPIIQFDLREPDSLKDDSFVIPNGFNLTVSSGTLLGTSIDGIGGAAQISSVTLIHDSAALESKITSKISIEYTLLLWVQAPVSTSPSDLTTLELSIGDVIVRLEYRQFPSILESLLIAKINCPGTTFFDSVFLNTGSLTHFTPLTRRLITLVNSATGMKVFIDGVLIASLTNSYPLNNFGCGGFMESVKFFFSTTTKTFQVSNFWIFNGTRTTSEIIEFYNQTHQFNFPAPFTCNGRLCDEQLTCGGNNGFCFSQDNCVCTFPFTGPECCDLVKCPGLGGFNFTLDDSQFVCSGHGDCVNPGVCSCDDGFKLTSPEGGTCIIEQCNGIDFNDPSVCSNHGTCINEICICTPGFIGFDCSQANCTAVCQNGGNCVGPNVCDCPAGLWTGPTCTIPICTNCTGDHQTCTSPNTCVCETGFQGPTCDAPICLPTNPLCNDTNSTCVAPAICICNSGLANLGQGFCEPICVNPQCDVNAACTAPEVCVCNSPNFSGNGIACDPVCTGPACQPNSTCTNVDGTPTCVCDVGFGENLGSPGICDPLCSTPPCDPNANCTAPETCVCNGPEFTGDGTTCNPICSPTCGTNEECATVNGIPTCICVPNANEINGNCF